MVQFRACAPNADGNKLSYNDAVVDGKRLARKPVLKCGDSTVSILTAISKVCAAPKEDRERERRFKRARSTGAATAGDGE